jgi:acetyl-CoA acetyltransferase
MSRATPVAIVGIGYSEFARSLEANGDVLAIAACREAIADAGLSCSDVDGIATYLGAYEQAELSSVIPGVGLSEDRLGLREDLMALAPAAMTSISSAVEAIRSGVAHTVLTYKANKWKRGVPPGAANNAPLVGGIQQFTVPYGHSMTAQWLALWAMRHFHQYGTTHEHLGRLVVNTRRNAGLNPRATLRAPLTLEDYFRSPWISEPFRRLDCDFPIDGAGALVLTTVERARDLAQRPIYILGCARRDGQMEEWEMWPDLTTMASKSVSDQVWAESGLGPAEVDVAEVYDGFSFLALCWLEDAGFCAKGEGGPFVASSAIELTGELPTNTHGGNLSEGRSHGVGAILEAVQQLRGACGPRQVAGAKVAFAANGGGPIAGAMVLSSELS